jgi:hypothetical protein
MNSASSLPEWVERKLEGVSVYSDKRGLAELLTDIFGAPISPRTVEDRPLVWQIYNGYAVTHTRTAVEDEYARFNAAPRYRSGRAKPVATSADVDMK